MLVAEELDARCGALRVEPAGFDALCNNQAAIPDTLPMSRRMIDESKPVDTRLARLTQFANTHRCRGS